MFQSTEAQAFRTNAILYALPCEDSFRIQHSTHLQLLAPGQVIHRAGEVVHFVYFPTTCLIAHSFTTRDGVSASMALTGNEGLIGLAVLLHAQKAPHDTIVQIGGQALKVAAPVLKAEFAKAGLLQQALLRYMHVFINQLAQNAACNRLHSLEQRLCRCLLACHDRVCGDEVFITQEAIASIVGGRRESVTLAAGRLQDWHIIRNTRGRIQILDRTALEALACECYGSSIHKQARPERSSSVHPLATETQVQCKVMS